MFFKDLSIYINCEDINDSIKDIIKKNSISFIKVKKLELNNKFFKYPNSLFLIIDKKVDIKEFINQLKHQFERNDIKHTLYLTVGSTYHANHINHNSDIIISHYNLKEKFNTTDIIRHFEKEKDMYDYVSFNHIDNSFFLFIGIFNDPHKLTSLYHGENQEFLYWMRNHSKLFLDTDSRELAFGKIEELYTNGKLDV